MRAQFNDSIHSDTLHLPLLILAQAWASERGLMMSLLAPMRPQISPIPLFALIIHMINAFSQLIDN